MPNTKIYYIVDDDADDQEFLMEALKENNLQAKCYSAFNGREALNYLSVATNSLPDAIFLDLNMPRMGGKQCLAELKLLPRLKDIPVIIYSTTTNKREKQELMQMGAFSFLEKYINSKQLSDGLSVITNALKDKEKTNLAITLYI